MDTKTLYYKLSLVPLNVKRWLGSDAIIDEVENTERQFNLPGGSSGIISKLIQRLEIKDVEPRYFAGELSLKLKLDKDRALLISAYVARTILSPVKKELADEEIDISLLEKFEIPPIVKSQPNAASGPVLVLDVGPTPAAAPAAPARAAVNSMSVPTRPEIVITASATPGWSTTPTQPAGKSNQPSMPPPAPPAKPASPPEKGPVSEFERLASQSGQKAGTSIPAAATTMPAPVIIHSDTSFKPQQKVPDFHLPVSTERFDMTRPTSAPIAKPAMLELGNATLPKKITSTPRIVHYSEYKSPSPETPTIPKNSVPPTSQGQRRFTEVTLPPPIPKPPTPPSPPAPPAPPKR